MSVCHRGTDLDNCITSLYLVEFGNKYKRHPMPNIGFNLRSCFFVSLGAIVVDVVGIFSKVLSSTDAAWKSKRLLAK